MTPDEQKELLEGIASGAVERIKRMIDVGEIPADWSVVELRWYLQDEIEWKSPDDKKRYRDFKRVKVNNGL